MRKTKTFDLYAFVAGAALETGKPFPLECNCGAIVTIMPPFDDEHVVCCQITKFQTPIDVIPSTSIWLKNRCPVGT